MKKILSTVILTVILTIGIFAPSAHAGSTPLTGWAWSSNIGWISFNSANTGSRGGSYNVIVSTTTPTDPAAPLSGYAWSTNVGWISFNSTDVTGCPTGSDGTIPPLNSCTSTVDFSTGKVTGWARLLSSVAPENGGGWIQLSGLNHNTLGSGGVTLSISGPTKNDFSGFAYESSALGWISFAASIPGSGVCVGTCDGTPQPPPALTFTAGNGVGAPVVGTAGVGPTLNVPVNTPVTFNWNIQNMDRCLAPVGNALSEWNLVSNKPSTAGTQINSGTVTYGSSGIHTLPVQCYSPGTPSLLIPRTININVANPPSSLTCALAPMHALQCTSQGSTIFNYGSFTIPPAPSNTSTIDIVGVCPSSTGTYYCTYVCDTANGYKKRGNSCIKSSIQEF